MLITFRIKITLQPIVSLRSLDALTMVGLTVPSIVVAQRKGALTREGGTDPSFTPARRGSANDPVWGTCDEAWSQDLDCGQRFLDDGLELAQHLIGDFIVHPSCFASSFLRVLTHSFLCTVLVRCSQASCRSLQPPVWKHSPRTAYLSRTNRTWTYKLARSRMADGSHYRQEPTAVSVRAPWFRGRATVPQGGKKQSAAGCKTTKQRARDESFFVTFVFFLLKHLHPLQMDSNKGNEKASCWRYSLIQTPRPVHLGHTVCSSWILKGTAVRSNHGENAIEWYL